MRSEWVSKRRGQANVTQLHLAREGVVTEEMSRVAARERLPVEEIRAEVARGRMVIPANLNHPELDPLGIGIAATCKINANIGNSAVTSDIKKELEKLQLCFYISCQKVWKQWKAMGIDPGQLFDAALNAPKALRDLIKQAANDRGAQLLRDVAAEIQDADMEALICRFLDAAWDDVEGQLQINRRENARSMDFIRKVQRMLNRIARGLLNNPSRFPNRPTRNELPLDLDTQLGQSLL